MKKKISQLLLACSLLLSLMPAMAVERMTYLHNDALGSPVTATDAGGKVVWRESYRPYGSRLKKQAGVNNTIWYTGKPEEKDLGLSYFGARWYDPQVGRFMGMDPVGFQEGNVHSFNRYGYATNNPYRYVDPDGEWIEDLFIGVPSLAWGTYSMGKNLYEGNYGWAAVDAAGIIADAGAILTPGVPGGVGFGIQASRQGGKQLGKTLAQDVAKGAGKASNKAPDFVVSPGGTAFPVPKGATGPSSVVNPGGKTTGSAFTGGKGGANGQVDTIRIMNPTPARGKSPGYPNGYIKYENKAGQGVDPYTGRTLPNKNSHFPID